MKKLSLLVLVLSFLASTAFAEQYVKAKAGFYFPEESEFDDGENIKIGYGLSLSNLMPEAATNRFLSKVSAEAGIGYYTAEFKERTFIGGTTTTVDADYGVVPVTLTAVYDHPMPDLPELSFYGGAGLGLYFWSGDTKVRAATTGGTLVLSDKDDDSGVEPGVHFLAGAAYKLAPQWSVTADLQWDLISDDIGGTFLNAGVKYNF